ncbi:LysR family transcriptional regulator [Lentzea flava]|uniref:LysR family transcriptional regulator n=1 Tax=Lentzea flava TaxID=103732 RepID=A0ABQ2VFD4_9PSEU|nr:LysR family transcriptional regulator [Lentzea flava]MCP2205174.1 DNA-binding transcriptional regulator, LysR family [Lentzea flava]GGU84337.1 LysR family transcriptional regulator [Lentzea flava]
MLDLGRLKALHAVATHGTVGAAAEVLGYTPSAVSQQIAKLERETRTTLLERQGRGVRLTDAALLLADTAGQVLKLVEEAEVALEEQRGAAIGRLCIGSFATAARGLLPDVLAALIEQHPALDVRLTEIDPPQATEAVARGELDLAIVHDWQNTPLPVPESLSRVHVADDVAEVLIPAANPLSQKEFLEPADLAGERWMCQPEGSICNDWLVRTFHGAGFEPELAYRISEYRTQMALLAKGIGVALIPRLGRGEVPDNVRVVPLRPTPTRRLYAVWRTQASRRPAIKAALDVIRQVAL